MQSITIEQLRAANDAGGVAGVVLKAQAGSFLVQVLTRAGDIALLAKARSSEPRRFGNPVAVFNVLRDVGITTGQFDLSEWNPSEKEASPGHRGRAEALRQAHQAAAYSQWVAGELQDASQDSAPSLTHDEVMSELQARTSASRHKPPGRGRS